MVSTTQRLTLDDVERGELPDGRWEVIDGAIVEMPPASTEHSRISVEIGGALASFVKPRRLGITIGADGGVVLAEGPIQLRVPDAGCRLCASRAVAG